MMSGKFTVHNSQITIHSFLQAANEQLSSISDSPFLDAQVLLAHFTGKPRSWLLAHPENPLTAIQQGKLANALHRLLAGEPLPYILGHWEFFGLDFIVTPDTLIPRPETETLVEEALHWLGAFPDRRQVADIGTESGCIAISLAVNLPDLNVTATDISPSALAVARQNIQKHNVENQINIIQANLMDVQTLKRSTFDMICANLPYIPTETLKTLDVYKREPTLALDGGPNGLKLITQLMKQATRFLAPGGLLLLEIESSQGESALSLARNYFPAAQIDLISDLAGHDRIIRIEKSKAIYP